MKGVFVQTAIVREDLEKIMRTGVIGSWPKALGFQPARFKDKPLSFCSYVSEAYPEVYGNRQGVIFEPTKPVVYACPVDTTELMRAGNFLPGYEQFIFNSVEAMLAKYPTSQDFKLAFQEYFRSLKPEEVYPKTSIVFTKREAQMTYENDYCLEKSWNSGCNEVTFPKPMKVKNCRVFNLPAELRRFINPEKPLELSLMVQTN